MKITRDEYAKSYVIEVEGKFYYWNPPIESRLNQKEGAIEAPSQEPCKNLFAPNDVVRHRKGGTYKVIGRCTIEATLADCYAYRGEDGRMWVRPVGEMEDGRFERIEAAPSQEPVAWMITHEGTCMGFLPWKAEGTVPVFTTTPDSAAQIAYWQADSAAAWDKCEERRIENAKLTAAARMAQAYAMKVQDTIAPITIREEGRFNDLYNEGNAVAQALRDALGKVK